MLKQLLANPIVQFLIGRTIGGYMLLVNWTTRWRSVNRAQAERIWSESGGVIACVWHGRFVLTHALWRFRAPAQPVKFLISLSREGGLVTHTARAVGAEVVRGSAAKGAKRKGGFEATREMKRHIDAGGCVGLTPDGPRGPRMRAKLGPVQLAKMTGAPLFPIVWSTRWRLTMKSWDRFLLPLPFGPGALVWGEPILVARDADDAALEAARAALEAEMIRITNEADRIAGAPLIEPAPAPEPAPPAEAVSVS